MHSEVFVPTSWTKTTTIVPNNPDRESWPEVININKNVFDLSVMVNNEIEEDLLDCDENIIINYNYMNNEIFFIEKMRQSPRQLVDDEKENIVEDSNCREFTYLLQVIDHEAKATMYYDVKLARVEIAKDEEKKPISNSGVVNEDLEVIADLDEDNPFITEFDTPKDLIKNEK